MNEQDQNQISTAAGYDSPTERPENSQSPETNHPVDRPYGDAGNLYEIPRVRSDDPPMRQWWSDDEPQQDASGSQQNG